MYDFNLPTSAQQQVKVETTSSVSSKSDTSVAACKPQEGDAAAATEKSAFGEITSCENGASQQLTSEQQQMTFHFPTPPNEDGEVPSANSTLAQQEKAASKPQASNNEPNIILSGGSIASYNEQELGNKLSNYPSGGTNGESKSSMSSGLTAYSSAMHTQSFAQQQDGNDVAKYAVSTNSLSTSQYSNSTLAKKKSRTNACELRFVVRNLK